MAKKDTKKGIVGIYISLKEIAIAEIHLKGAGKLQPDHLIKFSTDFPKKSGIMRPMSLNADFFKPTAAWVSKFKTAVGKISWSASNAIITLSENFSVLRYFTMPSVPRKFWSKSIPLESKKYIPLSYDNIVMDHDAVISEQGKKLSVLFGISQKDTLAFLTALMKEVGFNLHSLEIAPVSLERLFSYIDSKDHYTHGYVHAAEDATHLLFSAGGRPVLYREFENDKNSMSERRRLDLKGAIQFVSRYTQGDTFKSIVLSGEYAQLMQEVVIKEAAPLPVNLLNLEPCLGTKDSSSSILFAIGAALFEKFPSKLRLDISGISTAIRVKAEIEKIVYTIGGIIAILLLLFILNGRRKISAVAGELAHYTQENSSSDLTGSNADEISKKVDDMRQQSQVLAYVFAHNDFLAPKLSVLVDIIPKQLWLDNIFYFNPVALDASGSYGGKSGGHALSYTGSTYLTGEPRAQVIEGFANMLKNRKEYPVCHAPYGNMNLTVSAASKRRPGQVARDDDGVSTFGIECRTGGQ